MRVDLEYRRAGEAFSGRLRGLGDDGSGFSTDFFNYSFAQMMRALHLVLVEYKDAFVLLHRLERPGLVGYELDKETLELLRIDPVAAIKLMSPTVGSSTLPSPKTKSDKTIPSPQNFLRIGSETLAEAFGETVLVRCRTGRAECPKCGRYRADYAERAGVIACVTCDFFVPATPLGGMSEWVSVSVPDLLATQLERYFLPREWNKDPPWIFFDDLNQKYQEYLLKKKRVEQQLEKETQI